MKIKSLVSLRPSIHYIVWAQGMFWSIWGLVIASKMLSDTLYALIPIWFSFWLLMYLLTWTGKVLSQLSVRNVFEEATEEMKKSRITSPYFRR